MRNDGHFGQFKTFSQKGLHIWTERVTFHDVSRKIHQITILKNESL